MPDTSISPNSNTDIGDTTTDTNQPTTGAYAQGSPQTPSESDDNGQQLQPTQQPPAGSQGSPRPNPQTPSEQDDPNTSRQQQTSPRQANQPQGGVFNVPAVQDHPAIQRASLLRNVAQTLAGGPRYKESIDVNTGQMTRQPVPLSKSDIGMAIALEAISGAMSGLALTGPGATGRAASAGFQQVSQQQKEAEQQQDQQANADYARHAQVFETNLRMHQNAQSIGRQNLETNENYVSQFKPLADQLQSDHPEIVKGLVSEGDLTKYHVTKDSAIPVNVVPRLDPNTGRQVVNQYEEPQWDVQYLVIDPSFKSDNFLSDDDKAEAAKFRLPGFTDSNGKAANLPQSLPMRLSMALNYKARIASLKLADSDLQNYYDSLNTSTGKRTNTITPINLVDAVKDDPTLIGALERFQPLLNATGGNYEHAIGELGKTNPQSAGKVLALYGGSTAVRQYDQMQTDEDAAQKKRAQLAETVAEQRALIPVRAAQAGAEETARGRAKAQVDRETSEQGLAAAQNEQPVNGVRYGYLQSLPADEAAMIQAIGEGRSRLSDYAAGRKDGAQIIRQVATAYPDFDKSKVDAYFKTRTEFTSGKTSKGISALNTALSHLNTMYQNVSWEATTPVISGLAQTAGNQSVTDYRTAQAQVAKEIETAYKNGALTDKDSADAKALLSASTPMEARAKAKSLVHLLDGKLTAYDHQLAVSRPSSVVQPLDIMSDEAKSAYQSITGSVPETGKEQASAYRRQGNGTQQSRPQTQGTSNLTNIQINPQTQQQIGWNGTQWVDVKTGQVQK